MNLDPAAPRASYVVWVAILLCLTAYGFSAVHRQVKSGNDFPIYLQAATQLGHHESPYDLNTGLHGYVYPPALAEFLSPLTLLPVRAAAWVWHLFNTALVGAILCLLLGLTRLQVPGNRAFLFTGLAFLVLGRFVLDNLDTGQVNLLITALLLYAVRQFTRDETPFLALLAVAVAMAIKPYAVLLLIPLTLQRRFRAVAYTVGLALLVTFVPSLLHHGFGFTQLLFQDWTDKIVSPAQEGLLQSSRIWDQSPSAALRRLVLGDPAFGETSVNLWTVSQTTYARLNLLVRAILVAIVLHAFWKGRRFRDPWRLSCLYAVGLIAMVTVVGYNLRSQFVIILWPWMVCLLLAFHPARSERVLGRGDQCAWAVATAILLFGSPLFLGRTGANYAYAYSAITIATIVLLVVLVRGTGGLGDRGGPATGRNFPSRNSPADVINYP